MTRARKMKQDTQDITNSSMNTPQAPVDPVRPEAEPPAESRRKRRKLQQGERIQAVLEPWTSEFLAEQQSADSNILPVHVWLESGAKPQWEDMRGESPDLKAHWQQFDSFKLLSGIIYRVLDSPEQTRQLLLPRSLRDEFLALVHGEVAGHLGAAKTRVHVGRRAYWFRWRVDTDVYCRNCITCNKYCKGRTAPKKGKLQPMTMGAPVERWACDLAGPFPTSSKGHSYILTAVCVFTKYIVLIPLRDKLATTVARAIMHHVFLKYGAGEILTDNGLEFKNELLSELCRLMGIARCFTTSYQPRTNAVCERSHATVNSMLAKCVSDNHRDWDEHLPQVAFCYNGSVHESTKYTPYFLMHGSKPRWDVDIQLGKQGAEPKSVNEYAHTLLRRLENAHELTRSHLHTNATRMSDWYDKKVRVQTFNPGDEVYVLNLRLYQGRCPKWLNRYADTAVVVRRINQATYMIKYDAGRAREKIVHVDKLKLKNRSAAEPPVMPE